MLLYLMYIKLCAMLIQFNNRMITIIIVFGHITHILWSYT